MNHLAKARECIEKGDKFYAQAAKHMLAARDEGKTYDEIAEGVGKSDRWVRTTLKSYLSSPEPDPETLTVNWERGSHATTAEIDAGTTRLLTEAPLEQVEHLLDSIPVSRRAALATALVAQNEVAQAIHADPEASKVHLRMTDEIVANAVHRGRERGRSESRTIRDIEASRHYSDAAKEMADGNAIVFAHSPEGEDLARCDAAVARVRQHVATYEEIRGLVTD